MQFQCTADNPSEAAIAEYVATIISLQDRLCTASARAKSLEIELNEARKKIAEFEKPKDAPKIEPI